MRRFVRELEGQAQGERRLQRLLFFVTSLTSIPSCGLRRKITVEVEAAAGAASSAAALPVASTCFYTLSLPCYASFAELEGLSMEHFGEQMDEESDEFWGMFRSS